MKIDIKSYSSVFTLISAILFLILGAVMYTNPREVVIFTTYIFGGLLIIVGIFKCTKKEYHNLTGQIKYMYFEEIDILENN